MEKEQIIPEDILQDANKAYPNAAVRYSLKSKLKRVYIQGRIDERARLEYIKVAAFKAGAQDAIANHPHKWSDEEIKQKASDVTSTKWEVNAYIKGYKQALIDLQCQTK